MVDFAGWDMPIHYGSQIEEHHQVRNDAGMFDVSHMVVLDFKGNTISKPRVLAIPPLILSCAMLMDRILCVYQISVKKSPWL